VKDLSFAMNSKFELNMDKKRSNPEKKWDFLQAFGILKIKAPSSEAKRAKKTISKRFKRTH